MSKKYAGIEALRTFLTNCKEIFANITHKHTISDITDYKVDSALSSTSTNPVQNKVLDAEFDAISTAMGALESAIDDKVDASHTHDDRYYTETEIDSKILAVDTSISNITSGSTTVAKAEEATHATTADSADEATHAATADTATSATSATSATKATQDGSGNTITSTYETKTDASAKLTEAKSYTDTSISNLINSAPTTLDTLGEIATAMEENADVVEALETAIGTKADATHSHEISDVTNLQSALDGKAASSHGTHVTYSTTAPVMDGTASVGSASTVARSDHKHPTDTSRAAKTDLDSHTSNTTVHITSTERTNWNAAKTHADSAHAPSNAEANQNAFSYVKVGDTSIAADSKTDTLTLVAGTNVTLTPDATGDSVTISAKDTNTTYSAGTGISLSGTTFSNSGVRSISTGSSNGTISVNTNGTSANVAVKGLGSAAYTASTAYDAAGSADNALEAAKTYTDEVATGKAASSHNHTASNITSGTLSSDRLPTIPISKGGTGATTAAAALTNLGLTATAAELNKLDGVTATTAELNYVDGVTSNIQTQLDGKAASSHTHKVANISDLTATATELNYMDGVTSNVQTQLDGKASSSHALSKGTDSTASKSLSFGGTFTAVTDTAVSGHKITDTTTTYTMPSDRLFTTLVPTGTAITTEGVDLNTTTYLKVGRYYCSANAKAKTLLNCPTSNAFMMEVYSPLSVTIDNEDTSTYVYRIRKLTDYRTGLTYIQYVGSGATKGVFTYDDWFVSPQVGFTLDTSDTNDGSAALGNVTQPVYVDANARFASCKNIPSVTYGTCSTAAATAAKVISTSDTTWRLAAGSMVTVLFTNTNTAESPTFNVNGTGAKNVFYGASQITTSNLNYGGYAGRPMNFVYDGTQYRFTGWGYESGNTKTTTNSTDTSSKIYLVGATSQGSSKTTYSHGEVYVGTDHHVYSNSKQTVNLSDTQALTNKTYNGYTLGAACEKGVDTTATSGSTNLITSGAMYTALSGKAASSHTHNYAGSSSAGGSATSAEKLATSISINGMVVDGTANRWNYGTCSTAAATAEKLVNTVARAGFGVSTGSEITVKFTVSNTASNPTLNVDGSGAYPIYYRGAAITAAYLAANRTYTFRFNGTQWDLVGDIDTNTNTDTKVTQTNTTTNADYRVLLSGTADDTTRTETARKSTKLQFNPSNGTLETENLSSTFATNVGNGIELGFNASGHGGFIDFHYNDISDDFTSRICEYTSGTLTVDGSLKVTGTVSSPNAFVNSSDRRVKENIIPLGESSEQIDLHSELFDRLKPVQYNFIDGNNKTCYGLVAQDVIEAMNKVGINEDELDLVHHIYQKDIETGEETDRYGLAYTNLIALLIHEVQKLKAEVATLSQKTETVE